MRLFPAVKDGKSGYIDSTGQVVIDFAFDFLGSRDFSEGLASVMIDDKAGYIDGKGNIVIEPRFELAMPFSDGLAYVRINDSYGFIDKSGDFVIEPRYYSCDSFHDGYALVKDSVTSKGFFIDKEGNRMLSGRNLLVSKLSEGLVNCPDRKGNWGYVAIDGDVVVDFKYKYTKPFSEGKGAFSPVSGKDANPNRMDRFGFINSRDELLIAPIFQGVGLGFSEGLCAVWDKGYGCIDENGVLVIPYDYQFIKDFKEGLAICKPKGRNKKYGFIDKSGTVRVEPKYQHVDDFHHGLSAVVVGTAYDNFKYGYIDRDGNEVWEPRR